MTSGFEERCKWPFSHPFIPLPPRALAVSFDISYQDTWRQPQKSSGWYLALLVVQQEHRVSRSTSAKGNANMHFRSILYGDILRQRRKNRPDEQNNRRESPIWEMLLNFYSNLYEKGWLASHQCSGCLWRHCYAHHFRYSSSRGTVSNLLRVPSVLFGSV